MSLHYAKNPMYALCLLAAICVRQHVQNNRVDQPLTKGLTLQTPTTGLTKPNEASLKTATNWNKETGKRSKSKRKLDEGDTLLRCVQNFARRARRIVGDLRSVLPIKASSEKADCVDPLASFGILDSLLYLTSNVGIKWLA